MGSDLPGMRDARAARRVAGFGKILRGTPEQRVRM
jgi:hypothetical protein